MTVSGFQVSIPHHTIYSWSDVSDQSERITELRMQEISGKQIAVLCIFTALSYGLFWLKYIVIPMDFFLNITRRIRYTSWPVSLSKANSSVPVGGVGQLSPRSLKAICFISSFNVFFSPLLLLSVFPTSKLEFYLLLSHPFLLHFICHILSIQNGFFTPWCVPHTHTLPSTSKVSGFVFAL